MPLAAVQRFFAVYLRNPAFREAYRSGGAASLHEALGLAPDDVELVEGIDLDVLDTTAVGFRDDRIQKRWGEFSQFLTHLGGYADPQGFLELWDRAFPEGRMDRPSEMARFLTFGTEYVVANGLPDYLIDLLRFCYYYTKIADAPVTDVEGALEHLPPSGLRAFHLLQLRGPFHVLHSRHDVLALASSPPDRGHAALPAKPVRILIQKDRHRAKRTTVRHVDALPFVSRLLDADAVAVSDLLAELPAPQYPAALGQLTWLFDQDVVAVTEPPYLRAAAAASAH